MMVSIRLLYLALACLGIGVGSASSWAQDGLPLEVRSVRFGEVRALGIDGPYYEMAIELEARTAGEGFRSGDLVGPIEVQIQLATEARRRGERTNEYYQLTVELVGIEVGNRRVVYCYLPPEVVKRDQLRSGEPLGWRVALAVNGRALPNVPGSYSNNLREPRVAESFLAQIQQQGALNDGILQPIYMTPLFDRETGRREASPSYIRRDAPRVGAPSAPVTR